MSRQSELNSYIERIQQRLKLGAWMRGTAIFTGTALVVTVVLVLLLNKLAFPTNGVTGARFGLFVALAAAAVLARPCRWSGSLASERYGKPKPRILNWSSALLHSMTSNAMAAIRFSNCWPPIRSP